MPKTSNLEATELPEHVLDTRYLKELGERIFPPQESRNGEEEQEETIIEKVGRGLQGLAWLRLCACDPNGRPREEGFDEDSDDEDGWYCEFRDNESKLKMHDLLHYARLDIDAAEPSDFPKDIREEISTRYLLEYEKDLRVQTQKQSKGSKPFSPPSPPPPPPPPPRFPPLSFQHLPSEILVDIVLLAQASNPHVHITLSHVDASLRSFVNSTPLLWSRIDFLYPLSMVHTYLERSADTLLRLTVLPPHNIGASYSPLLLDVKREEHIKITQFFRALRPHRHRILFLRLRCDDLGFDVSDENEDQFMVRDWLWDGSMVELEVLDLQVSVWRWEAMTVISSSYPIKELHLRGPMIRCYTPLFSTHLRSLVIANHPIPFRSILDGLHQTPFLTSLTFYGALFTGTEQMEGSVVTLDHLESLALIRVLGSAPEVVSKWIATANLASYTFQHVASLHQTADPKHINAVQLFPSPQPSVRRLDLIACDAEPSWFDSVFRTFPCITHLRIACSNISEEHLLGTVVKPTDHEEPGQTVLPDLQHLTIDNEFNVLTATYSLIASSRYGSGRPLKSMTLRGIPVGTDAARDDIHNIQRIVPNFELGDFDQDQDVYGDSEDSASETSSEGDWASGDDEVAAAFEKYYVSSSTYLSDDDEESEDE